MKTEALYNELKSSLADSTAKERQNWASTIIENEISIKELSRLLFTDRKTALRFQWMLSGIGHLNPKRLFNDLPYLFELSPKVEIIDFREAFATYWSIVGVPPQNEGEALDLLFELLSNQKTNSTIKTRALNALLVLMKKYPEIRNELKLCLEDQQGKSKGDFAKKVKKVLNGLIVKPQKK